LVEVVNASTCATSPMAGESLGGALALQASID